MSARAVSIEFLVNVGRKSTIKFSNAGPTANRLFMRVIAISPAPINMTNTEAVLLKGPDLDEGMADEVFDLEAVLVIPGSLLARRS